MNWQNLFGQVGEQVVYLATRSPLVESFWIAVGLLLLLLLRKPALRALCRLLGLDDAVVEREIERRIDVPLQILILILAVMPFIGMVPGVIGHILARAVRVVAPFLAVHITIQGLDLAFFRWFIRYHTHFDFPPVFRSVILGILYVATVLVLLNWGFGVDVLPLLATSTVITAVLGLALQDTLRNVFAGISVTVEKSCRPGDWIRFKSDPGGEQLGKIMEIGWRSTRLRTVTDSVVIVPNAQFTASGIINYNMPAEGLRLELGVPVPLDVEPEAVRKALIDVLATTEGVSTSPSPEVFAVEIRSNGVNYLLRFAVKVFEDREAVTASVIERVWLSLKKMDALHEQAGHE